jgi:hypothetical protein
LPPALREAVLALYRELEARPGFSLGELMRELEQRWPGQVTAATLRRWRKAEGLPPPRHRYRRGSWLPGERVYLLEAPMSDGGNLQLVLDGASGRYLAGVFRVVSSEEAWLTLLGRVCAADGIPLRCVGGLTQLPHRERLLRLLRRLGVAWSPVRTLRLEDQPFHWQRRVGELVRAVSSLGSPRALEADAVLEAEAEHERRRVMRHEGPDAWVRVNPLHVVQALEAAREGAK